MKTSEFTKIFPSFRSAAHGMLDDLLSVSRRQSVPAGTQIYHEGDACNGIAFVLSGDIRVYKIGQTGREITLYDIGPGETCILNASCILAGQSYPAHATAVADTELLLVPAAEFRRMVSGHEMMREFVFSLLSRRLSGVMELVEEVAFGRMDERLNDYLVERSADGRLETTHQRIANDLGTSREVVSRLLK
ncbi:MAG: Crp/Fnr family transcriptional regulator, partial [Nitrospirota bacterium]